MPLTDSTCNTLHSNVNIDFVLVAVQARAYGEAEHVPGADQKDHGLWGRD